MSRAPQPALPSDLAEKLGALTRVEEQLGAIEEHRWELQHRINLVKDDVIRLQQLDLTATVAALHADMEAFRAEMRDLYEHAYGALGSDFRRHLVPGTEDTLIKRFGPQERERRRTEKPEPP